MRTKEQRIKSKNLAARRPELGSWHTITERAIKSKHGERVQWHAVEIEDTSQCRGKWHYIGEGGKPSKIDWKTDLWVWHPAPPITSYLAMYIGYRYKQNGKWEANQEGDWEHGYNPVGPLYFSQTETIEVWLFVTHDNRKPFEVFPFEYPPLTIGD